MSDSSTKVTGWERPTLTMSRRKFGMMDAATELDTLTLVLSLSTQGIRVLTWVSMNERVSRSLPKRAAAS